MAGLSQGVATPKTLEFYSIHHNGISLEALKRHSTAQKVFLVQDEKSFLSMAFSLRFCGIKKEDCGSATEAIFESNFPLRQLCIGEIFCA
jgi:hypothetical protein